MNCLLKTTAVQSHLNSFVGENKNRPTNTLKRYVTAWIRKSRMIKINFAV